MGNKNILRTKDFVDGVAKPEIEDLLRETLISIVKSEYGVDTSSTVSSHPQRPIIDVFSKEVSNFSKYKLAKAYIKWTKNNDAGSLTTQEQENWKKLIQHINNALK